MQRQLVIVGASGAGSEALWIARAMGTNEGPEWDVIGFLDDNPDLWGKECHGLPVLGGTKSLASIFKGDLLFVHVAVGRTASRSRIANQLILQGFQFGTLIHPSAVIAETAVVGSGSMVGPFAVIAPYACVGSHVLVNSHVGVGHHAVVGSFSTLCPGARVSGACELGEGVFLGSNAAILPKLKIGDRATVAASSMVVRSVAPLHTVMGVPARIVSRPKDLGASSTR